MWKRTGALIDIQPPKSWLEDPSEPLSEEIEELVGLTDRDLAGQRFDDEAILAALHEADIICAHNMEFDYSHLIKRFPGLESGWACSLRDIAWRQDHNLGQWGLSVGALLASAGYFSAEAHRAGPDTWATAMLLIMHARDGRTIASHMIDAARRTSIRLFAKTTFALLDTVGVQSRAVGGKKVMPRQWPMRRHGWCNCARLSCSSACALIIAIVILADFLRSLRL
jgi:DNA polymerase III epsilon subunit-like protein